MVVMNSKIKIFPKSGLFTELLNRWQKLSGFDIGFTYSSDFKVQCYCFDSDRDQSKF